MLGQEVATLVAEEVPAGTHRVVWDPSASSRQALPSGVYLYRLETKSFISTRKMLLVK